MRYSGFLVSDRKIEHDAEGNQVRQPNAVTEEFIHKFIAGDLVDVKVKHGQWSGPHKLLKYEIDPPKKGVNPAARMEIELGEKKFERWLIVGDQQVIRKHMPEEQKQRVRARLVKQ